ncbi:MAG: hypothetical protein ACXVZM_09990 [Terriglobales bacterium]
MAGHSISARDLAEIAVGKDIALQRAEYKKAMEGALDVTHSYWLRRQRVRLEQRDEGQQYS